MKKFYLYAGVLAAGMLAFSACSNDDDPIPSGGQNTEVAEGEGQVIRIAVANAGDGLNTKAGRPLTSSDAAQDIDVVRVVILDKDGKVVGANIINDWMNVSQDYSNDGQGKEYSWRLGKDEELATGDGYTVYAVGYSANTDYTMTYKYGPGDDDFGSWTDWTDRLSFGENKMQFVNAKLTLSDCIGEEIFAGSIANLSVNADNEFEYADGQENVLTLHRQVTGTIGYFKNIPVFPKNKREQVTEAAGYKEYLEGLRLQLVVSDLNDNIVMSSFNSEFRETGIDVDYIVNGTKIASISDDDPFVASFVNPDDLPAENGGLKDLYGDADKNKAYVVYSINPSLWFVGGDSDGNGYLDTNDAEDADNWVTPAGVDDNVAYQRGTVFGSNFLIPFAKTADKRTMQLQLVATVELPGASEGDAAIVAANAVVRAWNINLPQGDDQLTDGQQDRHIYYLDPTDGEPEKLDGNTPDTYEEKFDSYSLVRNHLYTVGAISQEENEPEDLSKETSCILRVNDNWEVVHKMEVE